MFEDEILKKIQSGETHMRPRWQFTAQKTLFIIAIILATLLALYLVSFALFLFRHAGWRTTPFLLLIAGIAMVAILEILMHHYAFSYRKPVLYSLIAILTVLFIASISIHRAHIHERLELRAQQRHLPVMGKIYRLHHFPTRTPRMIR